MAYLGKTYTLEKDEHFEDALKAFGVPDDKIKPFASYKSTIKIIKNGDSYTNYSDNVDGTREVTFKSGVEFDDVIGPDKFPVKAKYVVDGNTITQTMTSDKGSLVIKKEYSGNELVVTITSDKWDGVAKRYYKA